MKTQYKVADLFQVVSGSTPSTAIETYWSRNGHGIKWITPKDLSALETPFIETTERKITKEGLQSCSANIIPSNSLILSSRAPIGYVAILKDEMSCNQGCKALVPFNKETIDPTYFYYLFLNNQIELNHLGSGSTFKELSKTKLEGFQINVHDISEQKKIGQLLLETDIARQKRKVANVLTDQFLQSTFLSMFGDPIVNEKKWQLESLGRVCEKITDGTHSSPANTAVGDYKYITAKNIKRWGIDLTDTTYVSKKDHDLIYPRCNVQYEDVLYIKDGVTTGIAVVNTLKEQFSMLSSVALLRCNREIISPYYLSSFLNNNSVYESIRRDMGGAAITRLTLEKIKRIKVLIPPMDLQQKFASIVADTKQLRQKQKQSEIELENLFQALLQKYFG